MEMEFIPEFTEAMATVHNQARRIVKGKRTKRQRQCSPSANSSADGDCLIDEFQFTPVLSSQMSTEEDEDMANCLIMLARSVSDRPVMEGKIKSSDQIRLTDQKIEVATGGGNGKAGLYVYECKTCNRTFSSFQALGGHRASHKKPKSSVEEKKSSSSVYVYSSPPLTEYSEDNHHDRHKSPLEDDENERSMNLIVSNNVQKSSSSSGNNFVPNYNKRKIHECSICGSEFSSGQALGGHMRKHRPIPPSINRTGSIINTSDSTAADQSIEKSSTGVLTLDLNFPPPEIIDDVQSAFQFTASSSQRLMFSSPALVDCHY